MNIANRFHLLEEISSRFIAGAGFSVATLNLDHLVKLRRSTEFRTAYAQHSHVVADGNPIVWISRMAGRPVDLVPGCELVEPVADLAARHGAPMALLGSREATLTKAAAKLTAGRPGLSIVDCIAPTFGFDPCGPEADACIERLRRSGARVCFLALGAPKQEIFAARAQTQLPEMGFLSIGAGLDFIAGAQKRAPAWMRRMALEWLWRALTDPRRLTLRYLLCVMLIPSLTLDGLRLRGRLEPGPEELQKI